MIAAGPSVNSADVQHERVMNIKSSEAHSSLEFATDLADPFHGATRHPVRPAFMSPIATDVVDGFERAVVLGRAGRDEGDRR